MTRAIRDRILKDANGDISNHLRNHIHLTNCIHLKNHMHKQSPILTDRSLIRDLVVLQRSRSLRDPSMSPPSWNSPSAFDLLSRRGERDASIGNGRRSIGIELQRDDKGFSGSSPLLADARKSRVSPAEMSKRKDGVPAVSERSSKSGVRERRRSKREESFGRNLAAELLEGKDETPIDGNDLFHDIISGSSRRRDKKVNQKGRHRQADHLMTLSEQLHEVRGDSDDVASSQINRHGIHVHYDKSHGEVEANIRSHVNGLNRVKRRKFRGARRTRPAIASRDAVGQIEMSVASNSLAHGPSRSKYHMEEGEEYGDQNATRAPRNGCGIPWNWSRIHHRGKSFLDIAGRSFSCGLSDPKSKKTGPLPREGEFPDMPMRSDHSSSSSKFEGEALPLLTDDTDNAAAWVHDYSGELGIFADNLLKQEIDSDLNSEGRSGDRQKFQGYRNGRHQNLTQKYMPRTFRDLVGQSLVAQALSNAVAKRKVGLLYVFYGPHGTGKTSCARIFARALNCQSIEHPKPCGFCESCTAYEMGRSRNIREVGPISTFDFQSIMDLLDDMIVPQHPSQYRVFIFDDCDTLSTDSWSAISKVMDRGPRRVVFVFVSSSLDVLPHIVISRCQKFFFPKLKDADIIYTLQWIATKEDLEINKDALKLIASRSDGSLRDAEMTLDQLSLLGQRISVPLVQELVGLISDEKLVDLLDLALSADTVNTVKNLREIMESGVEPLALMSQLATVITDILAGTYDIMKGLPRRKFFRRQSLSKEDMEKLRQALKTLSEAEKQLRMSNDRLTWLTAALLQLAPDQQYMLPTSSADTSFNHSPLGLNAAGGREIPRRSNAEHTDVPNAARGLAMKGRMGNLQAGSSSNTFYDSKNPQQTVSGDKNRVSSKLLRGKFRNEIEEIWFEVLEKIRINSLREFMYKEGKLISVSFGAGSTAHLMFSSHLTQSRAEKFRAYILQAFESVLGPPVTIEIRYESNTTTEVNLPLILPASNSRTGDNLSQGQLVHFDSTGMPRSEIVEIEASPRHPKGNEPSRIDMRGAWKGNIESSHQNSMVPISEQRKLSEPNQNQSIVRGKVSLAHVIQQAEGCTKRNGWSKHKAVSIAEKLEQENLRLEPRSRSLLCWKATKLTRRKLSRFKVRTRKPQALLKYVSCGKCMSTRSPR